MPSGPVHNAATLTVAATSAVMVLYKTNGDGASAMYCALGALVGLICTPDWDLDGVPLSVRELVERPVHFAWRVFLSPYAHICKHRSAASHAPIISTLGRLAYVALWIIPLWICRGWEFPRLQAWMLWGVFGLMLADGTHALLDKLDELFGGRL